MEHSIALDLQSCFAPWALLNHFHSAAAAELWVGSFHMLHGLPRRERVPVSLVVNQPERSICACNCRVGAASSLGFAVNAPEKWLVQGPLSEQWLALRLKLPGVRC